MRKTTNLLFVTLVITGILLFPVKAESGHFTVLDSYWGTDQRVEVSPGETAIFTIVLRTELLGTVKNIEANLTLPEKFQSQSGTNIASTYSSSSVTQGMQLKLQFSIFIEPDASLGNHSAQLEMRYYQNGVTWQDPVEINLKVTGRPEIKVKTINNELVEGKQSTNLEVTNVGKADATNFKISEISSSSVIVEDYLFDELIESSGKQLINLHLMLPSGTKGKVFTILVKGSYYGPLNIAYQFSQSIQFIVKSAESKPILSVNLSKSELSIGKSDNISIILKNNGLENVSGVSVSLTVDSILKLFTPSELYIEQISSSKESSLLTQIYVPPTTQAATSTLGIIINYFNEGIRLTDSYEQKFNLLLRGNIEISLTDVTVIPSSPRMGSPFSITMTVTNIGTSAASAAYAIPDLTNLPLSSFGSKSSYIGNIEINSPITFTLNLQASNSTTTNIILPVTLKYMDNLRTIHEENFTVSFQLSPPVKTDTTNNTNSGNNINFYYYIAAGIIGLIFVGLILWRRR
ncbi:hypothetical protein FJY84_01200 [Candidatus Bathyarchaeota archaeon]|nr:hypothetical protein [Candidatus Bathyarchaeota archaeon]